MFFKYNIEKKINFKLFSTLKFFIYINTSIQSTRNLNYDFLKNYIFFMIKPKKNYSLNFI